METRALWHHELMTTIDIYVVECFLVLNNRFPLEVDVVSTDYRTIGRTKSFSRVVVVEQKLFLPCAQIENKGKDPNLTSGLFTPNSFKLPSPDQPDVI